MYKSRILIYTRRFTSSSTVNTILYLVLTLRVHIRKGRHYTGKYKTRNLNLTHNVRFYVVSPSYMYYTQYHNARAYCHKDEYLSSLPLVILLFISTLSVLFHFRYYYLVVPVNKMYLIKISKIVKRGKEGKHERGKKK